MVYILNYLFSTQLNENKLYKKYFIDKEVVVFDVGSNLGTFHNNYLKLFQKDYLKFTHLNQ